jgi:general secretion pathway protein F
MPTATLDDFMALNDQLAALLQAGVPMDIGLRRGAGDVLGQLQQINADVARRVSQGASLESALEHDEHATTAYRGLILTGLQSGNLSAALTGRSQLAQTVDGTSRALWRGMLYPLVVCFLAYVGLVGLCLYFVPTLEDLYRTLQLRSNWSLDLLQALRESLPVWAPIPPVLLLLLGLICRWRQGRQTSGSSRSWSWLPGMTQAVHWQRCGNFADSLATLLESHTPLEQAVATATSTADDATLQVAATELFGSSRLAQAGAAQTQAALRFPPFLRWALLESEATTGRPAALRMAARWYRAAAQRRIDRIRAVAPLVACVVIGGGAVLLYGLALFIPVVEMFRQLTP